MTDAINKKALSEQDICLKYITPAIQDAGWDKDTQMRMEVPFTDGRIIVRGKEVKRGVRKRADYILYWKPNIPLAVVEANLDDFLTKWTAAEQKTAIVEALEEQGVYFDALAEKVGRDYDAFDLICHVAFDQPPLTRSERAKMVKKRDYFTKYGEQARKVLEALLAKYEALGLRSIEKMDVLRIDPLDELGTPVEIVSWFGGKAGFLEALRELEKHLYTEAA